MSEQTTMTPFVMTNHRHQQADVQGGLELAKGWTDHMTWWCRACGQRLGETSLAPTDADLAALLVSTARLEPFE